jgi:hypothetical protein
VKILALIIGAWLLSCVPFWGWLAVGAWWLW